MVLIHCLIIKQGEKSMKTLGLFGEKLGHSLSPEIHEMIFKELKMKGTYSLFSIDKDNFHKSIDSIKTLGINGVNVTIPYKIDVMKYIDEISDDARKIGAVNTVKVEKHRTIGFNTDYYGFGDMLYKGDVIVNGNEFYILGAGGAAKGIVQYLNDHGAREIVLVARDKVKAIEAFGDSRTKVITYDNLKNVTEKYCIINTTPVGMYPKTRECPIDTSVLKEFKIAMDIVYNPVETLFLKEAKKLGLVTVDGIYMLVGQAIKAQEIWNDIVIEKSLLDKIYIHVKNILEK